ncbi:MAG: histone deacetylase family protein [Desulfatibacillaceae bacterium]
MEAIISAIELHVDFVDARPAEPEDILGVHSQIHVDSVSRQGLYDIAALAAGGAVLAAEIGMTEPCFAAIRPPGHHASPESCWGFCYFSNIAIAVDHLYRKGRIRTAHILDFDLHFGDGTNSAIGKRDYVSIHNPVAHDRVAYMDEVRKTLENRVADVIALSAGFDNHKADWGGVMHTGDYHDIGKLAALAARRNNGGLFAVLEGGYNHNVLGKNVLALIQGMEEGWNL